MLKGNALDAAILRLPSQPLRSTYFRAMPLRFATDPLGVKRPIFAQRFNVAGGARILYLAEDQLTCLHEAQLFGSPIVPVALVPIALDLHAIVDLRTREVQKILRTTRTELLFDFRSLATKFQPAPTQVLGEAVAASARIDGLLYESPALAGDADLAIIEKTLLSLGYSVVVTDSSSGLSARLP